MAQEKKLGWKLFQKEIMPTIVGDSDRDRHNECAKMWRQLSDDAIEAWNVKARNSFVPKDKVPIERLECLLTFEQMELRKVNCKH